MQRQISLDVVRALAVILVILHHCALASVWLLPVQRGGRVGVDLFFVLSGFLVSGLLFKQQANEGRIRPIHFLIRRGFKIYPAFWVFIAWSFVGFYAIGKGLDWTKLTNELLFVQSYTKERFWGHTWSLAIEEHFYILLPFVLIGVGDFKRLPRLVGAIMVALFVAKSINYFRPYAFQTHICPTHLRLDGLFFGVLLAYWHQTWDGFNQFCAKYRYPLFAVGCLILLPAFIWEVEYTPALYSYWLSAQVIGAGCILMSVIPGMPTNHVTKPLAYIGRYSYSIYLWHYPVVYALEGFCEGLGMAGVGIQLAASLAIGISMSELVETPILKLRDRLTASPKPTLAQGTTA
jgi:peptidoglycan/LPS O-acetylase OafA/YrhL